MWAGRILSGIEDALASHPWRTMLGRSPLFIVDLLSANSARCQHDCQQICLAYHGRAGTQRGVVCRAAFIEPATKL